MNKTSKGTILIVEDEEALQTTLRLSLSLEGYDVSVASDGVSALRRVREEYFDLIILDIMMPKKNGIEVIYDCFVNNSHLEINNSIIVFVSIGIYLGIKLFLNGKN